MYFVYILKSKVDQSYYKGHTNDIADRLRRHNNCEEKFSSKLAPWELVWCCIKENKSEAYRLEVKLKNRNRKLNRLFLNIIH